MLEDLTIKDFALIESDYIEFNKGFTVLSGETGAGKSILIGALSFLLGGKSDIHQIRNGCSEATVSATFFIKDLEVRKDFTAEDDCESAGEWLLKHGIEAENNRVILRRYIRDSGKSGAWINSTPITRQDLVEFS
ncbi:MAG: AAA family ATPase, partial [Treponema sp.]|nr:AAA family ATPase [Treponema sp.]